MRYARWRLAGAGQRGWAQLLLGAAVTLACAGSALAEDDAKAVPQATAQGTSLDEIIVSGEFDSLAAIKQALIDSENRFNARYNALNTDDAYDIVCRDDIPTDSHIPRRLCQARIVDEITAQEARDFFRTGGAVRTTPPDAVRRQAMFEVKERTLALVQSDPELRRDLLERSALAQKYEKLRKEKVK